MSAPLVCEVSGGYDSMAAVLSTLDTWPDSRVFGIFLDYGQPYIAPESVASKYVERFLIERYPDRFALTSMRLPLIFQGKNLEDVGGIYIPYRNLIIAAVSANFAVSVNATRVVVGSKTAVPRDDDQYSFRDSSAPFFEKLNEAMVAGTEPDASPVTFSQPLATGGAASDGSWTKEEVIKRLVVRGVDLRRLWNCYSPGPAPCGTCYHCKKMVEAVKASGEWERYSDWWKETADV